MGLEAVAKTTSRWTIVSWSSRGSSGAWGILARGGGVAGGIARAVVARAIVTGGRATGVRRPGPIPRGCSGSSHPHPRMTRRQ